MACLHHAAVAFMLAIFRFAGSLLQLYCELDGRCVVSQTPCNRAITWLSVQLYNVTL